MFPDPIAPENSGQLLSEATSELHEGFDAEAVSEDYGSAETGPESPPRDQVLESVRGGAEAEIGHSVISVIAGTDGSGSSSNSSFPEMIAAASTEPSTNADAVPVPMVRKRGRPRKNPLAVKVPPARVVQGEGDFFISAVVKQEDVSRLFTPEQVQQTEVKLRGLADHTLDVSDFSAIPAERESLPSAALGILAGGVTAVESSRPNNRQLPGTGLVESQEGKGTRPTEPVFEIRATLKPE